MTDRCRADRCGRPLKTEESRARGYGPVCWRRAHPTEPRPAATSSPAHAVDPDQIPLPLEAAVDAETRKQAIDTIARHALAREIDHAVACNRIDWGDYPDLVEADWDAVLARVQKLADSISPTVAAKEAAYQHLAPTVQEGPAA